MKDKLISTDPVLQYAESHFGDFLEDLKSLVRIASVSAAGFPKEEVNRSAQAVAELLRRDGFENVEILTLPNAHPYVYGDWLHAEGQPTVLLYAHHDVQPPGRLNLWTEPPFEPMEKNGRLTGRGSADDKAGIVAHSAAVRSYLKTAGKLPINVKFIIEGEEEIGSDSLTPFLQLHKERLKADALIITDTQNFDTGIPTITTSLRGIAMLGIEVRALERPLHSGMWGGPAPDATMALCKMVASLVDERGNIKIPGILDKVRPLLPVEEHSIEVLHYTNEEFRKQAGLLPGSEVVGNHEPPLVKITRLPSLTIHAFEASSRKEVSNRINESAWCQLSIRTVPDMKEAEVLEILKDYIRQQAPWGVEVHFTHESSGPWWLTNPDQPTLSKAQKALETAFGKECVFLGQGGSIPFVAQFTEALGGVPAILIGVEDPYTNAHAENESLDLGDFKKSITGAILVYKMLARRSSLGS